MNAICPGAGTTAIPHTTTHRIRCGAVWGGINSVNLDVTTSGITASVFSAASSGGRGGDIYYFSVCGVDALTRIAVADLQGHGEGVSLLSGWLYDSLEERLNTLDGAGVLEDLNERVYRQGFQAITTAAVVGYYLGDSNLYFCYAGHPPAFLHRQGEKEWRPLAMDASAKPSNLPLGILPSMRYCQTQTRIAPGDRIFLYTDGVSECPDAHEEQFGEQRLLDVLRANRNAPPRQIKLRVLESLYEHSGGSLAHDDVTFVVVEALDEG